MMLYWFLSITVQVTLFVLQTGTTPARVISTAFLTHTLNNDQEEQSYGAQ